MRGDLEILAYNMLQWLVGELPWEKNLKQPKAVQEMKEAFMKSVRSNITKQYSQVPGKKPMFNVCYYFNYKFYLESVKNRRNTRFLV